MFARSLSKRLSRALVLVFSVSVLCMMFSTTASAQLWDKKTSITFSAPIEIPGVGAQVLPAGTYIFKLLDSLSDRHIVQIFNADQTHVYATILAIPNYRLRATDKTVITFEERPVGEPPAIRAWFYPGDNTGQEFVYPKKRAVELARITNQPVIYIPDEVAPNIVEQVESETEPAAIALREAPLRAITPTGQDVPVAAVVVAPPVQVASVRPSQPASLPARLPKTASNLNLLALMGLLSIGVGLSLKGLCGR